MRGYKGILRVTQLREEIPLSGNVLLSGISGLVLCSFSKHHVRAVGKGTTFHLVPQSMWGSAQQFFELGLF